MGGRKQEEYKMEKELYYKLEDNGDLSCVCQTLTEASNIMDGYLGDWDPSEVEKVFFTITPIYMTEDEFNALGDAQF
jgi:hypothetical protein